MNAKLEVAKNYLRFKHQRFKSREELEQYQERKIKKQINFVVKHSSFYREYKEKKLSEYPIMDKKTMMEHFNSLNTVGIDKDKALSFAIDSEKTRNFTPTLQNITVGLSSGTSDTRGVFLVSDREKNQWAGYILSKVLYGSLLGSYKIAFFMRADSNLYEAVKSKNIQFEFFDILKPISQCMQRLESFKPDILVGQPSVLLEICNYMEEGALQISPEKVISIAEVLEEQDCEVIKKAFNLKIIHQVYQCTEGCLGVTCGYGILHLNEDILHIEKEYLDDKRFIPIVTDFSRRSQPIIRYRLNDILIERKEMCPCGSCFTALDRIEGREDDVFLFKNADNQQVKVFPDFIRRCILFAGEIENYRVVQDEDASLHIYTDCGEEMREWITREFEKLADEMQFVLPELQFLPYCYDNRKKLKRVESKIRRK